MAIKAKDVKVRTGFQILDVATGMYANSKADKSPDKLLFSKDGRFFTEAAAKNFKHHVLKTTARAYGGIEYMPTEAIQATLKFLENLVIVEVKVQVLRIDTEFNLVNTLKG